MTQIAEEKKEKMNKIETEIVGLKKSQLYRFRAKNKNGNISESVITEYRYKK